jgi:hypothetical protein
MSGGRHRHIASSSFALTHDGNAGAFWTYVETGYRKKPCSTSILSRQTLHGFGALDGRGIHLIGGGLPGVAELASVGLKELSETLPIFERNLVLLPEMGGDLGARDGKSVLAAANLLPWLWV